MSSLIFSIFLASMIWFLAKNLWRLTVECNSTLLSCWIQLFFQRNNQYDGSVDCTLLHINCKKWMKNETDLLF